jgi:hypothetical protein
VSVAGVAEALLAKELEKPRKHVCWKTGVGYLNQGYPKPLRTLHHKTLEKPHTYKGGAPSTAFRLARGLLDDAPRSLKKYPTRTTMGRSSRPWVEPADTSSPTYLQTKVKAFNATTNHFLPHGYSGNQHGSSTSVKSHFLLPIPGWAVKTYHCTRHTRHYSATDHPRGRTRRVPCPVILGTQPYPFPVDPPRSGLDQPSVNKGARPARHKTWGLFTTSSFTSPWCPGMADHS